MRIRVTLFALLIILTMITAQYGLAAGPIQQTEPTATPAAEETGAEHGHDETTAGETAAQAVMVVEPGQAFQVAIATYLMDTAGFHEIDERLNGNGARATPGWSIGSAQC
jgi:hypothetical protein